MLLPAPTTPTSTIIPQPKAGDANPAPNPDDKQVEPSNFEEAILWFQTQQATVEDDPLTPLEINLETPSEERMHALLGEEINAQTNMEKLHHPKLTSIKQIESLQIPEVESANIELPPQQSFIESPLNMSEDVGEFVEAELSIPKPQTHPTETASLTQKTATLNHSSESETIQLPDVQQENDSSPTNEHLKLDANASFSPEMTEATIPEALQPASKAVQSVTQQVAEHTMAQIAKNSSSQDSSFTVRLDPPELGEVLVSLKKSEGGIIMRVAAIEKTTQALLQLNEVDLSQAMTDHQNDVTMEFGSQSDFENSMFSEQNEFVTQRHSMTRHQANSTQSNSLQNLTTSEDSVHNFTA